MSQIEDSAGQVSLLTIPPDRWYDRLAAWIGDHSSPILIKECRQSLKSRQFLWTFVILLLATVSCSFLGLSIAASNEID